MQHLRAEPRHIGFSQAVQAVHGCAWLCITGNRPCRTERTNIATRCPPPVRRECQCVRVPTPLYDIHVLGCSGAWPHMAARRAPMHVHVYEPVEAIRLGRSNPSTVKVCPCTYCCCTINERCRPHRPHSTTIMLPGTLFVCTALATV